MSFCDVHNSIWCLYGLVSVWQGGIRFFTFWYHAWAGIRTHKLSMHINLLHRIPSSKPTFSKYEYILYDSEFVETKFLPNLASLDLERGHKVIGVVIARPLMWPPCHDMRWIAPVFRTFYKLVFVYSTPLLCWYGVFSFWESPDGGGDIRTSITRLLITAIGLKHNAHYHRLRWLVGYFPANQYPALPVDTRPSKYRSSIQCASLPLIDRHSKTWCDPNEIWIFAAINPQGEEVWW